MLCSKCKEDKDKNLFYKSKSNKRGFSSRCIVCTKQVAKDWKKENRQKVLDRRKEIYQRDKEKIELQNRQWELRNKEKIYNTHKLWKQNNKEKVRQYKYTRRIKEKTNGGIILAKEIKCLFRFYNNTCLRCKTKVDNITLDHVVPISKGGENSILNSQPLCLSCNDKKGTKTIDYRTEQQIRDFQYIIQQEKTMD